MIKTGEIIKKYRKHKNLTQIELAQKLEVTSKYLSDIETGRRKLSKKIFIKLDNLFPFTKEEVKILSDEFHQLTNLSLIKKNKELLEKEREIRDTYDFIRENNFSLSKVASINRELIELNKDLSSHIINLESLVHGITSDVLTRIKPSFKTTIKRIEYSKERLKEIIEKEEEILIEKENEKKMSLNIENLLTQVPLEKFTKPQIRIAILTWVAEDLKIRLKDYNIEGCPSGFSRRLWGVGRSSEGHRGYMPNRVKENIKLQTEGSEKLDELLEVLDDISDNIIDHSLIVAEDLLKAARNAKTNNVRKKYLESMSNQAFLLSTMQMAIIFYCKELIKDGQSINHEYLTTRIQGVEANKRKLNQIWKKYSLDEISLEEAAKETEEIFESYQNNINLTKEQLDQIATEKLIFNLMGRSTLEKYVLDLTEQITTNLTDKIRLIPLSEV